MPVAATLHSKCPNTPCTGGQCRVRRVRSNTADPRVRNRPTKEEKRLDARVDAFNQVGQTKTRFHRPGSKKK